MKKLIGLFIHILTVLVVAQILLVSCTDIMGDGTESILYEGSTLPQNTNFRNPVWEPDFELGTIFKGPISYTAISSETEWATGIKYCAPILNSNSLMDWNISSNTAFIYTPDTLVSGDDTTIYKRPDWAEGRVHSLAAGFTRTIPGTSYWLFYQLGDEPAIGVASARSAQGPYSDYGKLMGTETSGTEKISDPFFLIRGTSTYLFYSTENGSYMQQLLMKRDQIPTLSGDPVQISGASFSDVAVYYKNGYYYVFGTVTSGSNTSIHYARATDIVGPYVDQGGQSLLEGSGTLLIESGDQLINPYNVCGIFADFREDDFLLYNVTDESKPLLESGYNRRPLVLNKLDLTSDGWFEGVIQPYIGWTGPKFVDKE